MKDKKPVTGSGSYSDLARTICFFLQNILKLPSRDPVLLYRFHPAPTPLYTDPPQAHFVYLSLIHLIVYVIISILLSRC